MTSDLPPERLLLPFEAGPFRMALGLVAMPADTLIEIDGLYATEMAERLSLLTTRHTDVFAAEPGSDPACAAVLTLIADTLPRRYPAWFGRDGDTLHNRLTGEAWNLSQPGCHPLEAAGRLVQEDLCVIDTRGAEPVLAAAILCAPSRWRLAEKIGRPLGAVHGSVPFYADRLSRPVDRFMRALRPGRVVERLNWSVVDDGALFQVGGKFRTAHDPTITPGNAPDRLFVRVERQTLVGLEGHGAVLFAIRVHSYPLRRVLAVEGAGARLGEAVRALPAPVGQYKSLPAFQDALLACLDGAARPPGSINHPEV